MNAEKGSRKDYFKSYYEAHKEEILKRRKVSRKAYYEAHREEIIEQHKAYYEAQKEERERTFRRARGWA